MATPEHKQPLCPSCGSESVRRSHHKCLAEQCVSLLGARWRRCLDCHVRFARLWNTTIYAADARRLMRRAVLIGLMAAGTLVVVAAMKWLMNKQA
jgi:hypothetical protein